MFGSRLAVRNAMTLVGLFALVLLTVAQWHGAGQVLAAGTISGIVFQDYNGNGTQDTNSTLPNAGSGITKLAVDRGLGGVVVTAFDSSGASVGTATTVADGSYTLVASGTGPYRVEFSNFPTGFQAGPLGSDNGSTVRFVDDGTTSGVDLGIHLPDEYCQNNPDLVTSCFKEGGAAAVGAGERTVLSFPYVAGSDTGATLAPYRLPPTHTLNVPTPSTGAVWGLVHSRSRQTIYASAFFKKHVGFGPGADGTYHNTDDPGAIYVIDQASGAIQGALTVPNATRNSHDVNDYIQDGYDTAWNAVGKDSLGGLALSEDETTLYVMNLENRTLYALNANTGALIDLQTVPGVTAITGSDQSGTAPPLRAPATVAQCNQDDIRPFAVEYHRGLLYVGITCTAESTSDVDVLNDTNGNGWWDFYNVPPASRETFIDGDGNNTYNKGDARQLWAYIYTVDPATLQFSASPVLDFSLSYERGGTDEAFSAPATWLPWQPGFSWYPVNLGAGQLVVYPQPWLTDITVRNDELLLAIRDRTGDTTGYQAPSDPALGFGQLFDGGGFGDFLKSCRTSAGAWALESNGRCEGQGSGPQNDNEGPGGGEFFHDDGYGIRSSGFLHAETTVGGATYVPGHPDVVVTSFDAFPFYVSGSTVEVFNGGVRWLEMASGAYDKAHVLFDSDSSEPLTFGKANGLGDLIVLCDEAPIEVGNRVWRDDNLNGVQDPGEPPLAGVVLELYEPNNPVPIATAVTDSEGNYVFSAYRTTGDSTSAFQYGLDLQSNTTYTIRIANATGANQQSPLSGLLPTTPNAGGASGDSRDSDGVQSGTVVETTFTTGGVGANNHTYDFGFVAVPTAITLESFAARRVGGGAVVSWRTALELDTWGFHLYRSATGQLGDAERVTDALILAKGRGSAGASYSFVDMTATEGPYWYWLEEHTTGGAREVYGPVMTDQLSDDGQYRVWLPAVMR